MTSPSDDMTLGAVIRDRYRIERPLGAGGMGEVFLARDLRAFEKAVALKLIQRAPQEGRWYERFKREAQLTARLNSPHVVGFREFGETADGRPYIVMDLLEGESLEDAVEAEGALSLQLSLRIIDEILAGLEDIHALGIIHRDIKPSNVFLQSSAGVDKRACLIDLGIAKDAVQLEPNLTAIGKIMGSFNWMAPELIRGEEASPRSDLYAVGLVLLHALGVALPHGGDRPSGDGGLAFFKRRGGYKPIDFSTLKGAAGISAGLTSLLQRALTPRAEARFEDARAFRAALRSLKLLHGLPALSSARREGAPPPLPRAPSPSGAPLSDSAERAYPEFIEREDTRLKRLYDDLWTKVERRHPQATKNRILGASAGLLALIIVILVTVLLSSPPPVTPPPTTLAEAPARSLDMGLRLEDASVEEPSGFTEFLPDAGKRRRKPKAKPKAKPGACKASLRLLIKRTHKKIRGEVLIIPGLAVGRIGELVRRDARGECDLSASERAKLKEIAKTIGLP